MSKLCRNGGASKERSEEPVKSPKGVATRRHFRTAWVGNKRAALILGVMAICVDFWAPYEIGRNYIETASHGTVSCRAERDERDFRRVLARRG